MLVGFAYPAVQFIFNTTHEAETDYSDVRFMIIGIAVNPLRLRLSTLVNLRRLAPSTETIVLGGMNRVRCTEVLETA